MTLLNQNPVPLQHKPDVGSPYCSDPNCVYCQDLRAAQAQLQQGQPVTPSDRRTTA